MHSPKGGKVGSWGGSSEDAFSGRTKGAGAPAAPCPGLAHVDGVEDPLRELLQLVGGILDSYCNLRLSSRKGPVHS